jgi:hypothetical protein
MNHSTSLRATLLLLLLAVGMSLSGAHAQPRTQAQERSVYLPLLISGGTSTAPTPVPTPTPTPAPAGTGLFALHDWLTYNATTAVDAQGGVHLAFSVSDEKHKDNPSGEPAIYTYCPGPTSACADVANWSDLVNLGEWVNQVQVAVTADGRPRLLIRQNRTDQNWSDYLYFACEQQCTDASNWHSLLVARPAGIELFGYDTPQHSFALDSQGRPRFIFSNSWGNGQPDGIFYAYCDATDCTQPGTWSTAPMMERVPNRTLSGGYASLAFAGTSPRVVIMRNLTSFGDGLFYFACDEQDCSQTTSWSNMELVHPEGKLWANWDLALDAAGHPRIALYEAAPIDITVGGKLFYAACDADDCAVDTNWQLTQVASGEGKNVDLAIDAQGRTHMVYDAGSRGTIGEVWCDANCANAGQWQRRILETSEQLNQEFAPASPLSCNQEVRAWFDAIPSVAFDAQGRLVVAYDTKNVVTCYYDQGPGQPPGSRVERLWWAVRWAQFPRP